MRNLHGRRARNVAIVSSLGIAVVMVAIVNVGARWGSVGGPAHFTPAVGRAALGQS
jgi:hypothetical protein